MAKKRREWLVVRTPDTPEDRFEIDGKPVRIGRDRGNQIVLRDEFVSGTHAEIVERGGRRFVRDLGSTNGSEVNGQPLEPDASVALESGDSLQFGACTVVYHTDGAAQPATGFSRELDEGDRFSSIALPDPAARRRSGFVGGLLRLVLLIAVVVALLLAAVWALAPARVSLLVLGSDARPDEIRRGERGRTDSLMTIGADRPPAGAAIVSLPRDLWVDVPGYGEERINTAYQSGGADTAKRTVGNVLGIRVDRYLVVGLQGVRDVVNAAGGVEIDVEAPIHDEAYPTDDYGVMVVDIPVGRQRMDGETALRYARTRHQDSDFGRVARQQQVLVALRSTLMQPANWWRVPGVLAAVQRTTATDLNPFDLATLGLSLVGNPAGPERLVVGPGLVEDFFGAEGAYLLRPRPTMQQQVAVFLTPAAARVEVLNGSPTAGAAKRAADTLRGRGIQAVRFGDAGQPRRGTTIEVRTGSARAGRYVASLLDVRTDLVRESGGLPDDLDVRVTLGE